MWIFVCFFLFWMGVTWLTKLFLLSLCTSWKKYAPTRSSFAGWVSLFSMCRFMQAKKPDRIIESWGDVFLSRINLSVISSNKSHHWLIIPKKHKDRHPFRDVQQQLRWKARTPRLFAAAWHDPLSRVLGSWVWSCPCLKLKRRQSFWSCSS